MRIVVTGADGFIGKNLRVRLRELGLSDVVAITREHQRERARGDRRRAPISCSICRRQSAAGRAEFVAGNAGFHRSAVCSAALRPARRTPIVYASSTQAALDNPYGAASGRPRSAVASMRRATGAPVHVFRLPNVFGKWCRPNYNSAVATFCHNIARGLPITVNDPAAPLRLVYIDDVVDAFIGVAAMRRAAATRLQAVRPGSTRPRSASWPTAARVRREPRLADDAAVGTGLARALYATYVSYLPPRRFAYACRAHAIRAACSSRC